MKDITADLIKTLRQDTGAKMMDCKAALEATGGDMEEAKTWLRKQGMASGAKKTERPASEGAVGVFSQGKKGSLLEINCETDFVARTEDFKELMESVIKVGFSENNPVDIEELLTLTVSDTNVKDKALETSGRLGENIVLRRIRHMHVENGVVSSYIHAPLASNMGKIGVLVALHSDGPQDQLLEIGKNIAMHIVACQPLYVTTQDVPAEDIERERSFLLQQIQEKESGKPEAVITKMVEGRLAKFFEEKVLLVQKFIKDPSKTVAQFLEEESKRLGLSSNIILAGFQSMTLGN